MALVVGCEKVLLHRLFLKDVFDVQTVLRGWFESV